MGLYFRVCITVGSNELMQRQCRNVLTWGRRGKIEQCVFFFFFKLKS